MYAVSHMKGAGEYITDIIDGRKERYKKKPELTDEYIRLFEMIAHSDEFRQSGWEYCFNAGEFKLLAEYIFLNDKRKPAEIKAMLSPYRSSCSIENINILYRLWQNHYSNTNYIYLFHMINESDELRKYFSRQYGIDTSELVHFMADGRIPEYYGRIAGIDSNGEYDKYCEELQKTGIDEQSALYGECVNMYVLVCDGKAYMRMGTDTVKDFMNKLCYDDRIIMMQNMLHVLDSFQLKKFVSVFPLFREYVGESYSDSYRDIIAPLPEKIRKKYQLWQNQYFIYNILGDGEKADFWMGYADKGTFTKHGYAEVMFLCFETFTIIEFKTVDAAYFFNSNYFEKNIEPYICNMQTEREIEAWIYDNAEWSLDKTHKDHWRKAHIGSWQLDMKSYMSRNLVRI